MNPSSTTPQPLAAHEFEQVFDALKGCLSQDIGYQKQAEAALNMLQVRPGFCSCLVEIINNATADHSARWLAAVHLKNSINKYWRSRGVGSLGDDEKEHLRPKLLELIDQEDNQIAVQLAVVLAKVARLDFPRAWSTLFSDLLGRLTTASATNSTLTVRRVYLALHHILKELASKRLAADQRNFEQVTAQLIEPLWQQWNNDTQVLLQQLPLEIGAPPTAPLGTKTARQTQLLVTLERWLLQLKSLRRMVLFGYPSDAKTLQHVDAISHVVPGMMAILQQLDAISSTATGQTSQLGAMLDRAILKLVKSLRQIHEMHPWTFIKCGSLVPALEYSSGKILTVATNSMSTAVTNLLVQCLLFLHAVERCASYRASPATLALSSGTGRDQMNKLKAMAEEAKPIIASFWSNNNRLHTIVICILERLFPLTDRELDEWESDPETFHHEQESMAWEESIRGCAEQLYLALFEGHREAIAPLVMELLSTTGAACPPGAALSLANNPSIPRVHGIPLPLLAKEAAYSAAAIGSYELYDHVDLTAWLNSALLHEISDKTPCAAPLRRRAIKVVGKWASKLKKDDRVAVYRVLVEALEQGDVAVQLAAVVALKTLVDDWEFEEQQFLEFVGPCFTLLAGILTSAAEFDTQVEVFNLINLIIERLQAEIKPYAGGLMQLMPGVWQGSEGQSLLRIQILVALQRLVNALGVESPVCYSLVLPVVQFCTDPNQPDELNLLEDGLHLWLVALRNAPSDCSPEMVQGLLAPFPHLLAVMQRTTEHIAIGAKLITSCVLLGGPAVLQSHGIGLVQVLQGYIGNVTDRGMLAIIPVMDVIIRIFPEQGPQLLGPALTALLGLILQQQEHKPSGTVVAVSLGIFARILVHNPPALMQLLSDNSAALVALTDVWLDKFDSIGSLPNRKLSALGLCVLLTAPVPELLTRLELFVAHITAVWYEIEGDTPAAMEYYAAASIGPRDDDIHAAVNCEEAEGELQRRRMLFDKDPIKTVVLSSMCQIKMQEAAAVHGAEQMNAAAASMDPTLAQQFQQLLAGTTATS